MKKKFKSKLYILTLDSYLQVYSQSGSRRGWEYDKKYFRIQISHDSYNSLKWNYHLEVHTQPIWLEDNLIFETVEEALDVAIQKLLRIYNVFAKDIITILEGRHD